MYRRNKLREIDEWFLKKKKTGMLTFNAFKTERNMDLYSFLLFLRNTNIEFLAYYFKV